MKSTEHQFWVAPGVIDPMPPKLPLTTLEKLLLLVIFVSSMFAICTVGPMLLAAVAGWLK